MGRSRTGRRTIDSLFGRRRSMRRRSSSCRWEWVDVPGQGWEHGSGCVPDSGRDIGCVHDSGYIPDFGCVHDFGHDFGHDSGHDSGHDFDGKRSSETILDARSPPATSIETVAGVTNSSRTSLATKDSDAGFAARSIWEGTYEHPP